MIECHETLAYDGERHGFTPDNHRNAFLSGTRSAEHGVQQICHDGWRLRPSIVLTQR